jgi:hypothetical protein
MDESLAANFRSRRSKAAAMEREQEWDGFGEMTQKVGRMADAIDEPCIKDRNSAAAASCFTDRAGKRTAEVVRSF